MLTFGPVPSRRLGRSLGINNIPPKACSYSCVYCQVGPTPSTEIEPRAFYGPARIYAAVARHLERLQGSGERVDYLTFVPDGEPTLDARLGATLDRLRPLGIRLAVITNGSLLFREEVRERLAKADWVSVKLDAVDAGVWRRINRPHPALNHPQILDGILSFARGFAGTLTTETLLVRGLNDNAAQAHRVGRFIARLSPQMAYLAVPIRPPAEPGVRPPDEQAVTRYFQVVARRFRPVEILGGYEGDTFASTGDLAADLLAVAAVHPLRESAVRELVRRSGGDWGLVERLVADRLLVPTEFAGHRFYVRRMHP